VRHLLLESLMLLDAIPEPGMPLLDIGTGPGVPGLILKLARPAWRVTLLDAGRRPANFLRHVARVLELDGVAVEHGRAETLVRGAHARAFQTVTMRGVVGAGAAGRLAAAFLRPGGALVLPLAPEARPRKGQIREVAAPLGGELYLRRRFLIIAAADAEDDVSRGTPGPSDPGDRRRQPEGRGREDDHRP
jgi:16S rRNA (guanine527-N7)-methyltransferase